jgi:hypothetical protein
MNKVINRIVNEGSKIETFDRKALEAKWTANASDIGMSWIQNE